MRNRLLEGSMLDVPRRLPVEPLPYDSAWAEEPAPVERVASDIFRFVSRVDYDRTSERRRLAAAFIVR